MDAKEFFFKAREGPSPLELRTHRGFFFKPKTEMRRKISTAAGKALWGEKHRFVSGVGR